MVVITSRGKNRFFLFKPQQWFVTTFMVVLAVLFVSWISFWKSYSPQNHEFAYNDNNHQRTQQQKPATAATDDDEILDVLIIGGGWSGVSALEYLVSQDRNESSTPCSKIKLLEARHELGGRSRTIHNAFGNNGLTTELGSAWVYQDTALGALKDRWNVSYGTIDYFQTTNHTSSDENNTSNTWLTWNYLGVYAEPNGVFPTDDDVLVAWDDSHREWNDTEKQELLNYEFLDSFGTFVEREQERLNAIKDDSSIAATLKQLWKVLEDVPPRNRYRQFVVSFTKFRFEIEYGASIQDLSTAETGGSVQECLFCGCYHYMSVPGGGFDKMIAGLLHSIDLNHYVQFDSIVTKIDYSDKHLVRVTYLDSKTNELKTLSARYVLVTVSLGVLKANLIDFHPPLPAWKQSAIQRIGFGTVNKCILYWDAPQTSWWPEHRQVVTLITPKDDGNENDTETWTTFFNDRALENGGHYILTGFIGGRKALSEEQKTDEEVVATALQNLRRMFVGGDVVPPPTKYVITRWGHDPYTRGSYSYVPTGASQGMNLTRRDLARPVGLKRPQVYFAGEATNDFYATTTGAFRSGQWLASIIRIRLTAYRKQCCTAMVSSSSGIPRWKCDSACAQGY